MLDFLRFDTFQAKAKETLNRRKRKLRDIEGGDIVIRDALFRNLPERGRRFKNSPKDRPTPQPFYFFLFFKKKRMRVSGVTGVRGSAPKLKFKSDRKDHWTNGGVEVSIANP